MRNSCSFCWLLAAVVKEAERKSQTRRNVESNETYTPPPNPYLEDPAAAAAAAAAEEEEATPMASHTELWLEREAVLVDCFDEVVSREKLEIADLIGVRDTLRSHSHNI